MGGASALLHWLLTVWSQTCLAAVAAWPWVSGLLDSNFTTSVVGAFAGALGGALAAARIEQRNARVEAALEDIRNSNAGVTIVTGIIGATIGLKRQFVVKLVADYDALQARHAAYVAEAAAKGKAQLEPFHFNPDMQTMSPQGMPISELADFMVRNAGSDPAGWTVFNTLRQSISNIDLILGQRNEILEEMRTAPPQARNDMVALYLGRPRADGNVDARYPELMKGLPAQVDDVLGFSKVLVEHLAERARSIAKENKMKGQLLQRADLPPWEKAGLFPDMAESYAMLSTVKGTAAATTEAKPNG